MLIAEIARTSREVAAVRSRRAKTSLLAECLLAAGPGEVAIAVAYLSGELPQRQIGVGFAALRDLPPPGAGGTLTVPAVDAAFTAIGAVSGKGSVATRRTLLHALFAQTSEEERGFLIRLLSGDLRQGALDGVLLDAVATAAGLPAAEVRRAAMLRGALGPVATAALTSGLSGLRSFALQVGRPLRPMLAHSAPAVAEALAKLLPPAAPTDAEAPGGSAPEPDTGVAVEWKLDGVRVQAHVSEEGGAGRVRLFTRSLDDITERLPDITELLAGLPVRSAVLDGELLGLRPDGRPEPFQDIAARTGSKAAEEPSRLHFSCWDVLHLDGADLLDAPLRERYAALAGAIPAELRVPRIVTADADEAAAFFAEAVAKGYEGVVVKSLDAPYTAGRRGAGWIKVKPRHTLDLVVLAAEWGYGRRTGRLSNLHLGARDPETGGFVMLGKTFKGLTDELLAWQTARFQELALPDQPEDETQWLIRVRPELVVEIAFDGVQRSTRYPGGLALRFARVLRYRDDKTAAEADTIDTIRAIAATTLG